MDCAYCSFSNKKSLFFSDGSPATVSADKKILAFSITFFLLAAGSACAVYFTGASYYCYSGPAATGLISLTLIVVSLVRLNSKETEVYGLSRSNVVRESTLRKAFVQESDDQEEFKLLLNELKRKKKKDLKYENIAFVHHAPTSSILCFTADGRLYHERARFFNNPGESIVIIFTSDKKALKYKKDKQWPVEGDRVAFIDKGGKILVLDKRKGFIPALREAVNLIAD